MNSAMKTDPKRILVTLIGISILGIGVALITIAGLGTSCLDALDEVIANATGLSFGRVTFFAQILMVIVTLIVYPKNIGIGTLMAMFLTQFPIDFTYLFVERPQNLIIAVLMACIATVLIAIGAALIIHGGLGMGTYEAMTFSFHYRYHWPFVYVKYAFDSVFLVLALIFHGRIGIGTILSYLFLGKLIETFTEIFKKYVTFR